MDMLYLWHINSLKTIVKHKRFFFTKLFSNDNQMVKTSPEELDYTYQFFEKCFKT